MNKIRKYSRKREAILEKIRSTTTHPSADWVYTELRQEIPDLSLGTVYRNITMFKDENLLVSVGIINGQERFDGNTEPHAHFICESCGRVIDIDDAVDPSLINGICENNQVSISYHQLFFYGKCKDCG